MHVITSYLDTHVCKVAANVRNVSPLQRRLHSLTAHRLQQQLRPLRGAEDSRLHRRALGGFRRPGQPAGGQALPGLADDGQRPPGRDEGQAGEESLQGEAVGLKYEAPESQERWEIMTNYKGPVPNMSPESAC